MCGSFGAVDSARQMSLPPTAFVITDGTGLLDLKVRYSLKGMPSTWSHVLLVVDIASMKVFVWALGLFSWAFDPNSGVLDSHLFFYDRFSDLAEYHRLKGRTTKADRLAAIAEAYYQAAPDDDEPPEAVAIAMPVPRPPVNTNAVSSTYVPKPSANRPSDLAPSPAR